MLAAVSSQLSIYGSRTTSPRTSIDQSRVQTTASALVIRLLNLPSPLVGPKTEITAAASRAHTTYAIVRNEKAGKEWNELYIIAPQEIGELNSDKDLKLVRAPITFCHKRIDVLEFNDDHSFFCIGEDAIYKVTLKNNMTITSYQYFPLNFGFSTGANISNSRINIEPDGSLSVLHRDALFKYDLSTQEATPILRLSTNTADVQQFGEYIYVVLLNNFYHSDQVRETVLNAYTQNGINLIESTHYMGCYPYLSSSNNIMILSQYNFQGIVIVRHEDSKIIQTSVQINAICLPCITPNGEIAVLQDASLHLYSSDGLPLRSYLLKNPYGIFSRDPKHKRTLKYGNDGFARIGCKRIYRIQLPSTW